MCRSERFLSDYWRLSTIAMSSSGVDVPCGGQEVVHGHGPDQSGRPGIKMELRRHVGVTSKPSWCWSATRNRSPSSGLDALDASILCCRSMSAQPSLTRPLSCSGHSANLDPVNLPPTHLTRVFNLLDLPSLRSTPPKPDSERSSAIDPSGAMCTSLQGLGLILGT
jgi:hypothetical protein